MILSTVCIKNIKSIENSGEIHLSHTDLMTIIAGQNESGKSAFLRALKYFEEGRYSGFDEDERLSEKGYACVAVTFCLSESEESEFSNKYGDDVCNYLSTHGVTFIRGQTDIIDDTNIKVASTDDITGIVNEHNSNPDNEVAISIDNLVDDLLNMRPKFVYYSGELESNILPGEILIRDIEKSQAVRDFEKVFDVDFSNIFSSKYNHQKRSLVIGNIGENASETLNQFWSQKISEKEKSYKYKVDFSDNDNNLALSKLNFYVCDSSGRPLKMSQRSDGFKWFAGFTLRLRAHAAEFESKKIILLLDEPGLGLHEIGQSDVRKVIDELCYKRGIQVIMSTHLPIILGSDKVKFEQLLLASKNSKGNSSFKRINQAVSTSSFHDALSPVRSAIGLVTIPRFSKDEKVIIVEGISDYYFIKPFLNKDIKIIPAFGADKIPNIFSILFGWGVFPKAVFDGDKKGKSIYKKMLNQLSFPGSDEVDRFLFCLDDGVCLEGLLDEEDIKKVFDYTGIQCKDKETICDKINDIGKNLFFFKFCEYYSNNENMSSLSMKTKKKIEHLICFING